MIGTWVDAILSISMIHHDSDEILKVWPIFEVPATDHVVLMRPGGTARSTHMHHSVAANSV